jgi:hypothetical protein
MGVGLAPRRPPCKLVVLLVLVAWGFLSSADLRLLGHTCS